MTNFELALNNNISSKKILIDYYSSLKFSSKEELEYNQETIKIIAFAPITFFKNLANQLKVKLSDILEIFKNSEIVRFFSKIGWSFKKLLEILKNGFHYTKELAKVIVEFVNETKIGRATKENLTKLDDWLKQHPIAKRLSGHALGALLLFIYFMMANSGNLSYDFDLTDAFNALRGNFTLANIFGGTNGMILFSLFLSGVLLKISFPWPGTDVIQFTIAIVMTLAKKFRVKLRKQTQEDLINQVVSSRRI
jgi:hypothetical protein